jgi:hypothetical protein
MVIVTSHVFIGYIVRKTMQCENIILIVLQIVINIDSCCRKSYRLLSRHQNSTFGAIARRDIIIVLGIGLLLSKFK